MSQRPLEAIPRAVKRRKEAFRAVTDGSARMLDPSSGQDPCTQQPLGRQPQTDTLAQDGSQDGDENETAGRHVMLRLLAADFILPLLPNCPGRADLLQACIESHQSSSSLSPQETIDFMVACTQRFALLCSHRFLIDSDCSDIQRQSAPVVLWIIPRLLVNQAALFSHPPAQPDCFPLANHLIQGARELAHQASLLTASRSMVFPIFRAMLALALRAFTQVHRPAFSQTHPDIGALLDDPGSAPAPSSSDSRLVLLPRGLTFPDTSAPKAPAGVRVLWLNDDNMGLNIDLTVPDAPPEESKEVNAAASARFARALLSALVSTLAPFVRSDPAQFASFAITVIRAWLDNWRLDLSTVSAPPPGGPPATHVPSSIAATRVIAATQLVRLAEGGANGLASQIPCAIEFALSQVDVYLPLTTQHPSGADGTPIPEHGSRPMSDMDAFAQLIILKETTNLLQAIRALESQELMPTTRALLLPRASDLLAFVTSSTVMGEANVENTPGSLPHGGTQERLADDIHNWSKAYAWEALLCLASPVGPVWTQNRAILVDAVMRLSTEQAVAPSSESQPALTFLPGPPALGPSSIPIPAWMLPSQVQDTKALLKIDELIPSSKRAVSVEDGPTDNSSAPKRTRLSKDRDRRYPPLRPGPDARWTLEEILASPPLPLDPFADSDQFARAALRMCAFANGVLSSGAAAAHQGKWGCSACDAPAPCSTISVLTSMLPRRASSGNTGHSNSANSNFNPALAVASIATPDASKALDRIVRRVKTALNAHTMISSSPAGVTKAPQTQVAGVEGLSPAAVAKALQALRRILAHCQEPAVDDMDYIELFEMVKAALVVRSRACNVAAMDLLGTVGCRFEYLHTARKKPHALLVLNCINALHTQLLSISDSRITATAVESLGRIGLVKSDTLLENALLKLVEALGSGPYTGSLAYAQIAALARFKGGTAFQLLHPYIGPLSVLVVLKSSTMPSLLTEVLRLTGVSKTKFLQTTKNDVVPALIKSQQYELLQATANELGVTVPKLCNETMPFILRSTLLVDPRARQAAIDRLMALFTGPVTFVQLLRTYSSDVLGQLVLALAQDENHSLARSALEFIHTTVTNSPSRGGSNQQRSKNTPSFFSWLGSEAMAIHSWLCEELDGTHGRRSDSDRRVVIQAFARLTHLLGPHVSSIIPQLNTTLTSSLDKPPLRLAVLRAWKTLLGGLQASDMTLYLGQTVAALATIWPELDEQEQSQAKDIILDLIQTPDAQPSGHLELAEQNDGDNQRDYTLGAAAAARQVLARVHVSGPILDSMPAWVELRSAYASSRDKRSHLEAILGNLTSDNAALELQTLIVLRQFLRMEKQFVHALTSGDQFDPLVGRLLAALLAIPARLDVASSVEHNDLAFECLGLVGAVDPDRVSLNGGPDARMSTAMVINFGDEDEAAGFALLLVRDLLVRAFRTTGNSAHQVRLAYAIQQLLKFCGFSPALLDTAHTPSTQTKSGRALSKSGRILERWRSLPSHLLDTIAPLLGSRYTVYYVDGQSRPLPLCKHSTNYADWLQDWTGLLIKATRNTPAQDIFVVFRPVVLEHDLSIAQYILPHLVLAVLVYGEQESRDQIHTELVEVLRSLTENPSGSGGNEQPGHQTKILKMAQTVFGLLDHLSVWLRRKRMSSATTGGMRSMRTSTRVAGAPEQQKDHEAIIMIESVLDNIRPVVLAHASFETQSWARSLLHFEQTVRMTRTEAVKNSCKNPTALDANASDTSDELQGVYEKMHCIYAALDEPDGMEGITALVVDPSLEHQIREHESTGHWTAAQSCWELKLQNNPTNPDLHKGLLNCLRNLGHYDTMQTHIRGALSQHPEWQSLLNAYEVEGACLLSHWEEVARLVDLPSARSDKHALARLLLAIRMNDANAVQRALREARQQFGEPMVGVGEPKYEQVYESVLNLQAIEDLAQLYTQPDRSFELTKSLLSSRVAHTLPSFRIREVLLSAHRSGFNAMRSDVYDTSDPVAASWVQTSKFARRADHRQTAYSAMLQAQQLGAEYAFVQRAKLLVLDDQLQAAIQVMDHAFSIMRSKPGVSQDLSEGKRAIFAKAGLLRASIMEQTGRYSWNDLLETYMKVAAIDEHAERSWYAHGHYADSCRDSSIQNPLAVDLMVVKSMLRALACGTKYFFRTLPRILTIWLDNGESETLVAACHGGKPEGQIEGSTRIFLEINNRIAKAATQLPVYQWLAVFPQLVCRVTHRNDLVWKTLRMIITKVIEEYPAQAMWAVVGGYQSKDTQRRRRFRDIINRVKVSTDKAATIEKSKVNAERVEAVERKVRNTLRALDQAVLMAHELLVLCNFSVSASTKALSMSRDFPRLVELDTDQLLLPLQSSLIVSLPATNLLEPNHQPFASDLPRIKGFNDVVEVLSSLQKPRKITVYGTDGSSFNFLCKPKDDLRKDARLMDFDAMINKLLQANADSRRRKLYIRTYGVVTLNEECGLIEWVPNTIGLRQILAGLYKARGRNLYTGEIKRLFDQIRQDQRKAADIFTKDVLPLYPPVFHEWFVATFPEPSAWLSARLSYARTAAVMSMVGHVLGLGDRHGENILFDAISGDTVHVDLNCLFEKGQTFEIPERVPFRLTQNMVDALGVTGVDGVFRRAAEVSMAILRDNKDSLMSVLEAMIHDPLVEWTSSHRRKNQTGVDPRLAEARAALTTVRHKLEGFKRRQASSEIQLTTPNLVDSLIRDATSPTNLALMYIGWASYL